MPAKRFPRIKAEKGTEIHDFKEIVKKSDSWGGFMVLIDDEGLHIYSYQAHKHYKKIRGALAPVEKKITEWLDNLWRFGK